MFYFADMLTPDTKLVLVNTVYFKGEWRQEFEREATRKENFYLNDSTSVKAEMMNFTKTIDYGKFAEMDAHAIALSYKVLFYI